MFRCFRGENHDTIAHIALIDSSKFSVLGRSCFLHQTHRSPSIVENVYFIPENSRKIVIYYIFHAGKCVGVAWFVWQPKCSPVNQSARLTKLDFLIGIIPKLDNVWGAIRPKFSYSQIYAARYPIMPLIASKLVNFYTIFRHLCILKRGAFACCTHILSASAELLLATVVSIMQQKSQSARRDSAGPSDTRPIPIDISSLPYRDLEIFAKFLRTFWSIAPIRVSWSKILSQKFCLTMRNMFHTISRSHLQLFFLAGAFWGAKSP